jgi:hypothetical protein
MSKLFDPCCYTLACHFIDDLPHATEANRNELASTIQEAIEEWLQYQDAAAQAALDAYVDSKIDEYRESGGHPGALLKKKGSK